MPPNGLGTKNWRESNGGNMEEAQELSGAEATDSSVMEGLNKQEFNRSKEKEPIEKLADKIEANPESSDPESQSEVTDKVSDKKEEKVPPKKETFNAEKWDGNVEALPENIRKVIKDNQAAFTKSQQELAELRKQVEQPKQPVAAEPQPLQITQEDFEEAQINPNKFVDVVTRLVKQGVEEAKKELVPVVTNIQREQDIAKHQKAINDFAETHEDFWDLYEDGLLMPFIEKHKDLTRAYEEGKNILSKLEARANAQAQDRVREKKNASTFGKGTSHTENVMYIEGSKDDVLRKQIELAAEGKRIQVKLKK